VVGRRNWGKVDESLQMLDAARQVGIDTGSDVYPYLAGSTTMTALLPPWALEGGVEAMLARRFHRHGTLVCSSRRWDRW
jgi:dihydroorotase/N-acyl-D-amino-acid deacylase